MNPPKINLDQLITFYFVAREKSFAVASDKLCISQPAVTMQISALQKHFGVKLIHVKKKKVYLTRTGEDLFFQAEEICRGAIRAESLLEGYRNNNLRIGISGALTLYLIQVVDYFKELHPSIKVTVKEGRSLQLMEELIDFQHDFCIVGTFENINSQLQALHILETEKMVLVTASNDPVPENQKFMWKDLEKYPLILHGEGSMPRSLILAEFRKRGIKPYISAEIDSIEGMKQLIEKGKGVGLMFPPNVKDEVALGKMKIVPICDGDLKAGVDLVVIKDTDLSPPAKDFLGLIEEKFCCNTGLRG
jgi:LysR family transcriptional regulator, transcriptional activator of the cysJI operon